MRQSRDEGQEDVLSLHDEGFKRGNNQIFRKWANFAVCKVCVVRLHYLQCLSCFKCTSSNVILIRQLSGLVVECWPAALKVAVQTSDGEPQNFQYSLSSAETQQPVDRM